MRSLWILSLVLVSVSAQANETATARCSLSEKSYVTTDYQTYTLVGEQVVSQTSQTVYESDFVVLEDWVNPVSYRVEFNASHGTIKGSLSIKIDQPGPVDRAQVGMSDALNLTVEDLFNGGKVVYALSCQAN